MKRYKTKIAFYLISVILAASCTQPEEELFQRDEMLLSGDDWHLVSFDPGEGVADQAFDGGYPIDQAIAACVPGDVHWDLERAGKIPYLYYGMNTLDARWVTGKEWWYRKTFRLPQEWSGKTLRLHFDAVDYKTDVWLNGHYLGSHEGQFTPFEFDVTDECYSDEQNILSVMIHAVPEKVRKVISEERREWEVMRVMRPAYPYWKSMTSSGWDWGADLISMGIWQDVRLIASKDVYLSNLMVLPEVPAPYDRATLQVKMDVLAYKDIKVILDYRVRCLTADQQSVTSTQNAELTEGNQSLKEAMEIKDPHLWWPNSYGEQHMYELSVTVRDAEDSSPLDQLSTTFGIRDLEMVSNPKSPLMDMYLLGYPRSILEDSTQLPDYLIQINGMPIMGMGANWIPADLLFGRPDYNFYEHLIRLAAQANFNLFRIWGGGLLEKQEFFDLCDRYGIMLFAEFPNGGVRLPETDEALKITASETRQLLPLMINHPSVVRYGGGNEWNTNAGNSRQMAQMRQICNEMDSTRPFHDPDPEGFGQRHAPHSFEYKSWYNIFNTGYPMTNVGPDDPIEWTEYGTGGASSVATLNRIIPKENLFPIKPKDPFWTWHKAQDAYGIDNWLSSSQYLYLFGELPDLETTVKCSQFVQAEALRYANQSMRRNMWHRSAYASWTYNEPWPNAAHGCLVEYYGKTKMAYYYAQKSCAPVDVSCVYEDLECRPDKPLDLEVWVSNITSGCLEGNRYRWRIFNTQGKLLWKEEKAIELHPLESYIAGKIRWRPSPGMDGDVALVYVELIDSVNSVMVDHLYTFGIRNSVPQKPEEEPTQPLLRGLLEASPTKLEITAKNLEQTDKGTLKVILEVTNAGGNNGLFVGMDAETKGHFRVYFDKNYFFLPKNDSRKVAVELVSTEPDRPSEPVVFSAKAWNSISETLDIYIK